MASIIRVGGIVASRNVKFSSVLKPTKNFLGFAPCRVLSTTPAALQGEAPPQEGFWEKNRRLNRPVSPHLTIYKPQVTWVMSLLHRTTGIVLSAALSGFGIGMLLLPASYPYYVGVVAAAQWGPTAVWAAKFCLALPFSYHLLNGVRHLSWDLGYGFTLRTLYKSGYGVAALALLSALALASY